MNFKRIIVLGGTGMAGHMVFHYLNDTGKYELYNLVYRSKLTEDSILCDVRDTSMLRDVLRKLEPDIIINCIGALVNESTERPDNAAFLNSFLPHFLTRICDDMGGKLIHISTDCVFSGKKGSYSEDDFRDADDVYGRSKALGEIINERDCTLRTSIIGPELKREGYGLFNWFMNQNGEVGGFINAFWSGITTYQLGKSIENVIDQNLNGLFHLTNGEPISKYDLLLLLKQVWSMDNVQVTTAKTTPIDKTLKISRRYNFRIPTYSIMLMELLSAMVSLPTNKHYDM